MEEFNAWKDHPVTKKLFRYLREEIQGRKDAWADGALLDTTAYKQFIKEAIAKGYIDGCNTVLSIEAKDLEDNE